MAPPSVFRGAPAKVQPAARLGLHVQARHRADNDGDTAKMPGQEGTSGRQAMPAAGGH